MKQAATLISVLALLSPMTAIAASPQLPDPQTIKVSNNAEDEAFIPNNLPADIMYKILAAEMAISRGQLQIALTNYIDVAQETQDVNVAHRATQVALSVADLATAYIPGKIWADKDISNLEAQITFVAILTRMGKLDEITPYLLRTMALDEIDSDRHFVMLYKQFPDESDKNNLVKALNQVASETPLNLPYVALADISLYENRVEEGLAYAQKALKMNAKDPKGIILYTQGLFQNNQNEEAVSFIEQKIAQNPDDIYIRQYYTQYLIDQNQLDKARIQMQGLVDMQALDTKQKLQLARLSMQAGWLQEAETLLMDIRKDPEHADSAHYFLGRLYESQDIKDKAASWYSQVAAGPFHIIAHIRASTLYMDLKEYDQAMSVIEQARPENVSDLKRLILARVDVMMQSKEHEKGYQLLSEVLLSQPDDHDFLYSRAIVAEKLNKLDVVEQDLNTIIKQDPNHIDALNALGFILANRTDRYDEALAYINKALSLSPNNPSILDSLGWIQFKMGNHKEAVKTLRKALDLYPNPEIAAHLGEVLWTLNEREQAKAIWQDALENNPNDEQLLDTMERLIGVNGN